MTKHTLTPRRLRPRGAAVYPLAGLVTLIVVIVTLSAVLSGLTERHVYDLLSAEGRHLAASIKASTLHGLSRMRTSQDELLRRLKVQAAWLDTTLTGDPRHDGPLIVELGEREDLDVVAVYDPLLQPLIWSGGGPPRGEGPGPRWEAGPPHGRPPAMCPDVCGPLVGIMAKFYASGDAEQAFDTWGGRHGWNRSGTRPVAYARRRAGGGVVFLRTSDDLTRRTLDVDSFQGLLDNLALARKVRGIAVTDVQSTVLFSTDRTQIGSRWLDPPPEAQLLMVSEPFPLGADTPGTIRIALTTDDARQVLGTAGRNLSVLTLAASLIGVAGLLSVFTIERRHHARAETLREALHQHDRLADLGRMTATVAHEIRNPLNALGLTAQRLARMSSADGFRDDVQELASLVRQEVARLDRTVDAFLNLAKPPPTSRITFDLNELARAVAGLYAAEAEHGGVRLLHEPSPEPLEMDGDPDRLHQALSNLVRNAIESSPLAGSVRTTARKEGTSAVLRVEDTGQGFSVDALEHATAAFYTTKTQGMGLGLTLADRVAKDHGGSLALGNTERGGAWVELRIPLRGEHHR